MLRIAILAVVALLGSALAVKAETDGEKVTGIDPVKKPLTLSVDGKDKTLKADARGFLMARVFESGDTHARAQLTRRQHSEQLEKRVAPLPDRAQGTTLGVSAGTQVTITINGRTSELTRPSRAKEKSGSVGQGSFPRRVFDARLDRLRPALGIGIGIGTVGANDWYVILPNLRLFRITADPGHHKRQRKRHERSGSHDGFFPQFSWSIVNTRSRRCAGPGPHTAPSRTPVGTRPAYVPGVLSAPLSSRRPRNWQ
jgi:hypothetical protein